MQDPVEKQRFLESQALGAVLDEPELADDILGNLSIDSFQVPWNRNIYRVMQSLRKKNEVVTMLTIVTNFENNLESIGGVTYLSELSNSLVSKNNLDYTLTQLLESEAKRKWNQLLKEYEDKLKGDSEGYSFAEMLDEFEQKTLELRPKTLGKQTTTDSIIAWFEELCMKKEDPKRAFGMTLGWDEIDRMTLGLQRADFSVVGAATSIGKSAFANEVKLRVSERGYKVADFSLEMNKEQLYNRMVSRLTGISMQALRVGNVTDGQLEKITLAMDKIRKMGIDDTRGITVEYITSEMRRMKRKEGLDLVIIDYVQEIEEPSEKSDNGGSALKRICQKLRKAAKDCDCHVMGLSQLKQEINQRQNKRPTLGDFSGSKSIPDVADVVFFLYRDEYYNPDTDEKGIMEVNLAKQRNGPTGMVKMKFDKTTQRIGTGGEYVEQVACL
jgi:replicative DNA helicase